VQEFCDFAHARNLAGIFVRAIFHFLPRLSAA
jgi:hypothetical protein